MAMSCQFPFTVAEICPGGDVYTCCPVFTSSYSLGNIYQDSFEAIWNGERAKHLRRLLLNKDFTLCDLSKCIYYQEPKDLSQYTEIAPYPTKVIFDHDTECNCKCITCRDTLCSNSREELAELDSKIETHLLPMLQKAHIAYLAGNGDPFASRHYRKLIQRAAETYPSLRFDLHTNGLLCSRKQIQELGILDRLNYIGMSIHACTPETYAKVIPERFGDQWHTLKMLEGLPQKIDELAAMGNDNINTFITEFLLLVAQQNAVAQNGNVETGLLGFLKKVAHKLPEPVEAALKRIWRKLKHRS